MQLLLSIKSKAHKKGAEKAKKARMRAHTIIFTRICFNTAFQGLHMPFKKSELRHSRFAAQLNGDA